MGKRLFIVAAGILVVGALALGMFGTAMAAGWIGMPWSPHMMYTHAGPGGMMQGNGHPGGMMGGNGGGGMMGGGMMGGGWQSPAQATPVTDVTQVSIQNFAFAPANIQVKVGTTVTWTNRDSAPHTVTFRNGMGDSGLLKQGQSFSYTFASAGTFDYYCAVHPNMTARVVVTS